MSIQVGDLIRVRQPFYAGVVIGEAEHKLGVVWVVDGGEKKSIVFKDDPTLDIWVKGYK